MLKVCYISTDKVSQLNYQYDNFVLLIQLEFGILQSFRFFHVSVTLGTLAMSACKKSGRETSQTKTKNKIKNMPATLAVHSFNKEKTNNLNIL